MLLLTDKNKMSTPVPPRVCQSPGIPADEQSLCFSERSIDPTSALQHFLDSNFIYTNSTRFPLIYLSPVRLPIPASQLERHVFTCPFLFCREMPTSRKESPPSLRFTALTTWNAVSTSLDGSQCENTEAARRKIRRQKTHSLTQIILGASGVLNTCPHWDTSSGQSCVFPQWQQI